MLLILICLYCNDWWQTNLFSKKNNICQCLKKTLMRHDDYIKKLSLNNDYIKNSSKGSKVSQRQTL